ncbi:hypothetical protein [Streptomyces sp. NPDC090025]|uniref:hypothetical protein n=1 Tax=Streptomyces sp. NPDC090025 TaxID=3365922 RepID=UPI003838C533
MSRARRLTAALALTGALLALPACASSVDPIERLGRKAAEKVSPRPHPPKARAALPKARTEPVVPVVPVVPVEPAAPSAAAGSAAGSGPPASGGAGAEGSGTVGSGRALPLMRGRDVPAEQP